MAELDAQTRNILNAVEHTLRRTKETLDEKTHEAILTSLTKITLSVNDGFRAFKEGKMSKQQYGALLIRLAELTIMAVRKLPN